MRALVAIMVLIAAGGAQQQPKTESNTTGAPSAASPFLAGLFSLERLQEAVQHTSTTAEKCSSHLRRWAAAVNRREAWAFQMLESSSQQPLRTFPGYLIDLGNYDYCVSAGSNESDPVMGSYFLPITNIKTYKGEIVGASASGMCLPDSCDVAVVSEALDIALVQLSQDLGAAGHNLTVSRLHPVHPHQYRKLGTAEWMVLGLFVVLVTLAILGTAVDIFVPSPSQREHLKALLSFSIKANSIRLVAAPSPLGSFLSINGIRVMSLTWVILVHRWYFARKWPLNSSSISFEEETHRVFSFNGVLAVDTFFAIGGLVSSYWFHEKMAASQQFSFLRHVLHRVMRLTPALAVCVAFAATWADMIGRGPFASSRALGDKCRAEWWMTILYIGNFLSTEQCLPQTWYLAADMQLHILAPLVLLPMYRWPRAGLALTLALILGACIAPFVVTLVNHINGPYAMFSDEARFHIAAHALYYPFYSRIAPYLIGVLAGYVLFLDHRKAIPFIRSKMAVGLMWTSSPVLALAVLFWCVRVSRDVDGAHLIESAFYNGFYRVAWASAICMVVVACATGNGGPVNFILSWSGFAFFSRLSYSTYLVHYMVQAVADEWKRSPVQNTGFAVFAECLSDAALSFMVSLVPFLLVEEPFARLEALLWNKGSAVQKSKPEKQTELVVDSNIRFTLSSETRLRLDPDLKLKLDLDSKLKLDPDFKLKLEQELGPKFVTGPDDRSEPQAAAGRRTDTLGCT